MNTQRISTLTLATLLTAALAWNGWSQDGSAAGQEASKDTLSLGATMMKGMQSRTSGKDSIRCPACGGKVEMNATMMRAGRSQQERAIGGRMMMPATEHASASGMRGGMHQGDASFSHLVRRIQSLPEKGEQLSLSPEQLRTLTALRSDFRSEQLSYQKALQDARSRLEQALSSLAPPEQVEKTLDLVLGAERDMKLGIYRSYVRALDVLTPEQRNMVTGSEPRRTMPMHLR